MDKQRTLRLKTPIIILALVALVFTVLSCITYFVNYDWNGKLTIDFPEVFELISFLINIAPCVLLVIYLLVFHNEFKATVLVPVIFGLIAFAPIWSIIIENFIYRYAIPFRYLIFDILIIVAFALATIDALKGFSKKVFLIIAIVVGLLVELCSISNIFQVLNWRLIAGEYLYVFTLPLGVLGTIAFYVALLLFGLNNGVPAVLAVSSEKDKRNAEKMSPEQSLRLLKDKHDLGMITDEEYQAQRADIISKL